VGKPRISRIIGTLFGIATLTSLAMGLMAWLSLPKWTKVEAGLSAFQFSAPSSSEQALPRSTPSSGRMPLRSPTSRTLPRVDRSHPKTTILDYLIRRFASGSGGGVGGPPIRVCENLIDTPAVFPVDAGSYEQALLQIAQGDGDHENPYIESSLAPIAAALRLPAVGKFADAIERAKTSADPRLAEGDDFRSLTSLAASEARLSSLCFKSCYSACSSDRHEFERPSILRPRAVACYFTRPRNLSANGCRKSDAAEAPGARKNHTRTSRI
jgi:hypothetical protein